MNRKFLDALYAHKQDFETEVQRLEDVSVFPDDGFSFEVHTCRLANAKKMDSIFNDLIDLYIGEV